MKENCNKIQVFLFYTNQTQNCIVVLLVRYTFRLFKKLKMKMTETVKLLNFDIFNNNNNYDM